MMKLLVCALVALALPGVAAAKEVQSLEVCGASSCTTLTGDVAQPYIALLQSGGDSDARDVSANVPSQPYYRLVFTIGGEGAKPFTVTVWYVRPNLTRQDLSGAFRRVPAELTARLDAAAAAVGAIPAPGVVEARVNGRAARTAAAYNALFTDLPLAHVSSRAAANAKVRLVLRPNRPNPWFAAGRPLRFAPKSRVLFLATPVRVPQGLATTLARDGHFSLAGIGLDAFLASALVLAAAGVARKRKLTLFAVAAGALAVPTTALAKEIESVSVCGANGCAKVSGVARPMAAAFEGDTAQTILGAVPVGPFYRIGLRIRGDDPPSGAFSVELWYVRPNVIRWKDTRGVAGAPFMRLRASLAGRVDAVAKTLTPYAPPRVMRAYVNGKPVAQPRPYIGLFADLPTTDATTSSGERWLTIALSGDRPNPWITSGDAFLYLNEAQSLFLVKPLRVDDALAARIARDAGVPSPVRADAAGWVAPTGVGAFGVAAAVVAGLFWRRRRPRPTTP
jgi:hypothetical protein